MVEIRRTGSSRSSPLCGAFPFPFPLTCRSCASLSESGDLSTRERGSTPRTPGEVTARNHLRHRRLVHAEDLGSLARSDPLIVRG